MTYKELADALLALPLDQQQQQACVWPPGGCPAAEVVPVTGIDHAPFKQLVPVIVTGKKPS